MFTCLRNLLGQKRGSSKPAAASRSRSVSLRLETLEDRLTPSTFAAMPEVAPHMSQVINPEISMVSTQIQNTAQLSSSILRVSPHLFGSLPSFAGVTFRMTDSNGHTHTLSITKQIDYPNDTATFTGIWADGSGTKSEPLTTGMIWANPDGSLGIQFTWNGPNAAKGQHTFNGTLTLDPLTPWYNIEGNVTVQGGGGPGHLVGNDAPPLTLHF
jgi:hypothetical protein